MWQHFRVTCWQAGHSTPWEQKGQQEQVHGPWQPHGRRLEHLVWQTLSGLFRDVLVHVEHLGRTCPFLWWLFLTGTPLSYSKGHLMSPQT